MNYNEITTYEQTMELEKCIKLKNKADEIYRKFKQNIKLEICNYKGEGKFVHWSDGNNSVSFVLTDNVFMFHGNYINNTYRLEVTPSAIFSALKSENHKAKEGVKHLESQVRDKV